MTKEQIRELAKAVLPLLEAMKDVFEEKKVTLKFGIEKKLSIHL